MRHRIFAAMVILAFTAGLAQPEESAKPAPSPADRERAVRLIGQLGSDSFSEREAAYEELQRLGAAALDALQEAADGSDLEVRRRAADLIAQIEEQRIAAALLTPKRLRLKVDNVPVSAAVQELARISGYPVRMGIAAPKVAEARISLDTGDTTFWDALEQLCKKAGLAEALAMPLPHPNPYEIQPSGKLDVLPNPYAGIPAMAQPASDLVLNSSTLPDPPTFHSGSVRIRVARKGYEKAPDGETHLVLEVTAEPRLQQFGVVGLHRFEKAVDEHGKKLALAPGPYPLAVASTNQPAGGSGIVMKGRGGVAIAGNVAINGRVIINGVPIGGPSTPPIPSAKTLTVRLEKGETGAKRLREFSGVLTMQALNEPETLVAFDDVLKAKGRSKNAPGGRVLHVRAVDLDNNGEIRIQVGETSPHGGGNPLAGIIRGKGGGKLIINGVQWNALGAESDSVLSKYQIKLLDAAGKPLISLGIRSDAMTSLDGQPMRLVTFAFRAQEGQAEPARLAVCGQRLVLFQVPFTLKDVPLEP
jgi:hypothetical protein